MFAHCYMDHVRFTVNLPAILNFFGHHKALALFKINFEFYYNKIQNGRSSLVLFISMRYNFSEDKNFLKNK